MDNNNNSRGGGAVGVGFCDLLFVVFLVLKLTHVIDWSWWWVTAPLWIPLALVIVVCVIVGIIKLCIKRLIK